MIRICPQTGDVIEQEARQKSIRETPSESPLSLSSPRNAYVSFQVVVMSTASAAFAPTLSVEDLKSVRGQRIDREEFQCYVQWYHVIQGKYVPDALVPLGTKKAPARSTMDEVMRLNSVPDQKYAAVWVDLFVPGTIDPGIYRGALTVRNGTDSAQHRIELNVLKTTMANESLLIADLNSYADNLSRRTDSLRNRSTRYFDGSYFRLERQYYRMAHEHRALFHNLPYEHSGHIPSSFAPVLEGKGKSIRVQDWSLYDEHFGPYLDGSAFRHTKRGPIPLPYMYLPFNFHWPADYANFGTKGYRSEFTAIFEQFHRHFTEQGWLSTRFELFLNHKKRYKLFPYDGDETRFVWDEKINDLFYDLGRSVLESKEGAQFIFRTDSSWSYGLHYAKYAGLIRLWVVSNLIFSWYPDGLRELKRKGCTVLTYGRSPVIARSLLHSTFFPMATVARGTDGFVYWESTLWGEDWHETPVSGGSTALFYPGDQLFGIDGPIPSLRLKILRNAMQVAESMERWIRERDEEFRRAEMNALICDMFGINTQDWWPEQPEFVHLPPYEWSGAQLSVAPAVTVPPGRAPELFHELCRKLWERLD